MEKYLTFRYTGEREKIENIDKSKNFTSKR